MKLFRVIFCINFCCLDLPGLLAPSPQLIGTAGLHSCFPPCTTAQNLSVGSKVAVIAQFICFLSLSDDSFIA